MLIKTIFTLTYIWGYSIRWCTKTGQQQPRSHVYLRRYDGLFRVSEPSDSKAAESHILPLRYAVEIS